MPASIIQVGTSNAIPGGTYTNPLAAPVASVPTTAGNTILAFGGTVFDSLATTYTCFDSLGQTYTLLNYLSKSGDFSASFFICPNSQSIPVPVAKTITTSLGTSASSATLSAPWSGTTGVYTCTFSNGEHRVFSITNGSTTLAWGDGLGGAAGTAITIGFGPYLQGNNDGDWHVSIGIEVGGVTASPMVDHNAKINSAISAGNNNINTGNIACGTGSGILIVLAFNCGNGAGSPTFTPKLGTSPVNFTQFGTSFWDFGGGTATKLGILQYANLTNAGTVNPTAGCQETAADEYYMYGVFLADAGGGGGGGGTPQLSSGDYTAGGMATMSGGMACKSGRIHVPAPPRIFVPGMTRRAPRHQPLSLR
jgi:hypothetical protein